MSRHGEPFPHYPPQRRYHRGVVTPKSVAIATAAAPSAPRKPPVDGRGWRTGWGQTVCAQQSPRWL